MGSDISVVIPYFNEARSLPTTLVLLARQTLLPREVILVDSGSTDESYDLIERWVAGNPSEITFVNLRACLGMPSSSRNLGIRTAAGEWVALMDCGLLFEKDWLERQTAYLEEHGLDVVSGGCHFVGVTALDKMAVAHNLGYDRWRPTVPSTVVRRSVFDVTGLFRPGVRAGDDREWVWALSRCGIRRGINPEVVIRYNGSNYTGSTSHLCLKSYRYSQHIALMGWHREFVPYYALLGLCIAGVSLAWWSPLALLAVGAVASLTLGYVVPMAKSRGVRLFREHPSAVVLLPCVGLVIYAAKFVGFASGAIKYGVFRSHLKARTKAV